MEYDLFRRVGIKPADAPTLKCRTDAEQTFLK